MKIAIVDYGVGNLPNVQKAFARVGFPAEITADPAAVAAADGIVLPGVGAFARCMENLGAAGLMEPVLAAARRGTPLLGICVGTQMLFEESVEFGRTPGLGLLPGRVTRLPETVKVPQIGWNTVTPQYPHPLFAGPDGSAAGPGEPGQPAPFWAYFVHSYAAEGVDPGDVAGLTEYGRPFPSVVARGNIFGAQFHPERSSAAGLSLLRRFGELVRAWRGFTLFPAIDLKEGRAVRLLQGRADAVTDYGDPVAAAQRWLDAGARALHVVDLDGAFAGRPANGEAIQAIVAAARAAGVPVQLGGGLRSLEAIGAALDLGVTRAIIGTRALDGDLMRQALERFGPERIVAGIDARDGQVATEGWVNVTSIRAVDLAARLRTLGVRHCVYTDISRDGMLTGPNWDGLAAMAATGMLVVASGGMSSTADIERVRSLPGVAGAILGKALYTGAIPPEALQWGGQADAAR